MCLTFILLQVTIFHNLALGKKNGFSFHTWWNVPLSFELVSFIPFTVSCNLYQPLPLSPSCFPLGCIPHSLRLLTQLVFPKCFQSACNSQGYVNNFQIKSRHILSMRKGGAYRIRSRIKI